MPQETLCTKCGAPVSGELVGGFCTACLLEEGLSSADLAQNPITLQYFGDYELIEEIARGGMGVVFKARQRSLSRIVAVKMILSGHLASEGQAQRFRAEARATAALQHPGIVAIHEVGEHEGLLFFSMDYVAGQNLAQSVRDGPWVATRAAQCARDIAEAIQYAHEQGVLHRDLKPSNVLVDANGKPHVTDFGLAKQLNLDAQSSTDDPHLTLSGQVLGSPNFMPPEQAAGKHRELTPASDVYSLGAILYHCLTGRPPFVAETLTQTLRMVAEQEPVSPRLLNASVPRDLETICLKCLEKDQRRRYAAAQGLADELGRFLRHEPIQARPTGVVLKVHRWCVRNKPLAISGTAILALLLVVAIGSPIAAFRINRERAKAVALARSESEAKEAEAAQRKQAEAVTEFLTKAFRSPDPARDGRTITIVEVLDRGVQELQDKFADDPRTRATLLINIALAYSSLGLADRALPLFEKAVELRNGCLGAEDADTLWAKQDLARHYWVCGRLTQALPLAEEVFRVRLEKLGPDHTDTLWAQLAVGNFYFWVGRTKEGLELMERGYKVLLVKLGAEHAVIWWATTGIADAYRSLGRTEEALALDVPLLKLRRAKLGLDHPDTLHSMRAVAEDYIAIGRSQEASALLQDCVKLSLTRLGPDHSQTLWAEGRLAEVQRRSQFQVPVLELAIEPGPTIQLSHFPKGGTLGRIGRWEQAAAEMAKAVEAEPSDHNPYHLLAPLLVASEDLDGYRRHCERIQVQFAGTQEPLVCERMAKACLIIQVEKVDFQIINRWVKTALTADRNDLLFRYAQFVSGLAAYRQSDHARALENALTVLGLPGTDPNPEIAAWAVTAMANHGLKQTNAAVTALSKARELAKAKLPKLEAGDLGTGWNDWIITHALLREAGSLIEGTPPEFDPFSSKK